MEASPVISVVIPCHNSAGTIETTAASVLAQTFPDFELILVENGSTDRTYELCEGLAERDGRVRVHRLEAGSANGARNLGIEVAAGRLISFLDSDDIIKPTYLAHAKQLADAHPECGAFAIGGVLVDFHGRSSRLSRDLPTRGTKLLQFEDAVRGGLMTGMTILRAEAIRGIGGFRMGLVGGDDYDLWLRILGSGIKGVYAASDEYEHWVHPVSRGSTRDERAWTRHVSALIEELRDSLGMELTDGQRNMVLARVAKLEKQIAAVPARRDLEDRLLRGDRRHARRDYLRARFAYRIRSRFLLGLAVMIVSPRLFTKVVMDRRRAGFGLGGGV